MAHMQSGIKLSLILELAAKATATPDSAQHICQPLEPLKHPPPGSAKHTRDHPFGAALRRRVP